MESAILYRRIVYLSREKCKKRGNTVEKSTFLWYNKEVYNRSFTDSIYCL